MLYSRSLSFILLWDFHAAFDNDHPPTHSSIHPSIHPLTYPAIQPANHLFIHPSTQIYIHLIHPSIHPPTYLHIHLSTHPPSYPLTSRSIHLFIHPSTTQLSDVSPFSGPAPWLLSSCSPWVYSLFSTQPSLGTSPASLLPLAP